MKKYCGILAIMIVIACNNIEKKSTESADSVSKNPSKGQSISFKDENLAEIYSMYISLKDALVLAKPDKAQTAAKALTIELKTFRGCENTSLIADKIAKETDLAAQRKDFTNLSSDIIALFKHAELSTGTIFVQHCPMANNGDGGDWLATEKKIRNPYYGDEMLECGAVVAEIKAK